MSTSISSGVIDPSILGDEPASTFTRKESAAPAPSSQSANVPAAEASLQLSASNETQSSSRVLQTEAEVELSHSPSAAAPSKFAESRAASDAPSEQPVKRHTSAAGTPEPGEIGADDEGEPAQNVHHHHEHQPAHTFNAFAQQNTPSYLQSLIDSSAATSSAGATSSSQQQSRQSSPSPWDQAPIGAAWDTPGPVSSDWSRMIPSEYDARPSSLAAPAGRYQPPLSHQTGIGPWFTSPGKISEVPNPWKEEEEASAPASRDFDDAWGTPAPQGSSSSQNTSPWGAWSQPSTARDSGTVPTIESRPATPNLWTEAAQISGSGPRTDWPESTTSNSTWPSNPASSASVPVHDEAASALPASADESQQQESEEHAEPPNEPFVEPADHQDTSEPPVQVPAIHDQTPAEAPEGNAEAHYFTTRHLPPIVSGHRPPPAVTAMHKSGALVATSRSKPRRVRFYKGEDQQIPDPPARHRTAQEKARQRASVAAAAAASKKKPKPKPKTRSMPKARSETPAFQPSGLGSRTRRSARQPSYEQQVDEQASHAPQLLGGESASELESKSHQEQQAVEQRPSPATKAPRTSLHLKGPATSSQKGDSVPASASKQTLTSSSAPSISRAASQPKSKAPAKRRPPVVPSSDEDSDDTVMGDQSLEEHESQVTANDNEDDPDHVEEVSQSQSKNSPKRPTDLVRRPQQQQPLSNQRKRKEPEKSDSNAVVLIDQHQKEDDIMAEVLNRHVHHHNWEPLIESITTAELHPVRRTLQFFVEWKDGSKSWVPHQYVYGRAPQRCLKFYESRIRFGSNPPSPPPGFDATKSKSPAPPQKKRKK